MFIKYYKGEPNMFVIAYKNGKVSKKGIGKSMWYMPVNTTIANVPIVTQDAAFIFNEVTANFQEVAVQGQLTYRVEDPESTAKYMDFSIEPKSGRYKNKDPEKLVQRIVNTIQTYTRSCVNEMKLEDAVRDVKSISNTVLNEIVGVEEFSSLGIVIENLYITSISPNPEMQKALEADYREALKKRADQAVYDRRTAAQTEEDKLKRKEMETEVELEDRRKDLVNMQAENNLTLAEAEAKAEEMKLNPYSDMGPQALVAMALKEWAANTGKIGTLNINPDMMSQFVKWVGNDQKAVSNG